MKFNKYYKGIALGLVDIALVNAYIIHRVNAKRDGRKAMKHSKFLSELAYEMSVITAKDMQDDTYKVHLSPRPTSTCMIQ